MTSFQSVTLLMSMASQQHHIILQQDENQQSSIFEFLDVQQFLKDMKYHLKVKESKTNTTNKA